MSGVYFLKIFKSNLSSFALSLFYLSILFLTFLRFYIMLCLLNCITDTITVNRGPHVGQPCFKTSKAAGTNRI